MADTHAQAASLMVACDRMTRLALARDESGDDNCIDHTTPQSLGLTDSASSLPGGLSLNDARCGHRSNGTSNHSNSSGAIGDVVTKSLSGNDCRGKDAKVKKSDVCRHWARGFCNRGLACGFGHTGPSPEAHQKVDENGVPVEEELDEQAAFMKKHVPCKDHNSGKCNRGERCKFAHVGTGPKKCTPACRDYAAGICTRGVCKYKHEDAQGRLISAPGEPNNSAGVAHDVEGGAAVMQPIFVDSPQPQQLSGAMQPQMLPAVQWNPQFTLTPLIPQLSQQGNQPQVLQQPLQPAPAMQPPLNQPAQQQQQQQAVQQQAVQQQAVQQQAVQQQAVQQQAVQPPQLPQRGASIDSPPAQQMVVCHPQSVLQQPMLSAAPVQLSRASFPILVPSPTTDGSQNIIVSGDGRAWQVPAAQPIALQMSPDGNMISANAGFHDGSNAVMQHQPYA